MQVRFEFEQINRILKDVKNIFVQESVPVVPVLTKYSTLKEAEEKSEEWTEFENGSQWGGYNKHQQFAFEVVIPGEWKENEAAVFISTGGQEGWDIQNPQFLCTVNGEKKQGVDVNHRLIRLEQKPGQKVSVWLMGHSGFKEEKSMFYASLQRRDLLAEKFYYHAYVPFRTALLLPESSMERREIMEVLKQVVSILDLRDMSGKEFRDSMEKACELLEESFYREVPEEDNLHPTVTGIGHTHIDIAWLWDVAQTREKVVRSVSTVLQYMDRYPDYTFMMSQPQLYEFVKEEAPELYEKIKERIKEGRWEADGGMWVEADTNLTSGESLARQFLYGTRFFEEEFGVKCKTLWLPDVFGYSAAIPQILKQCDIPYFYTTKMDWNDHNRMPHDTFWWKGIDGSKCLTAFSTTTNAVEWKGDIKNTPNVVGQSTYNGRMDPNQVMGNWTRYHEKEICPETLQLFGFGDGGGGPTEEQLENYERMKYGIPGLPLVKQDFQKSYFERLEQAFEQSDDVPVWEGELYFEYHRGTYTSVADIKKQNRKCEYLMKEGEAAGVLAEETADVKFQELLYKQMWKLLLRNQFHDILPGSAIGKVYELAMKEYEEIRSNIGNERNTAIQALNQMIQVDENSVIVWNFSPFERTEIIELTSDVLKSDNGCIIPSSLRTADGILLKCVKTGEDTWICQVPEIPAYGYRVLEIVPTDQELQTDTVSGATGNMDTPDQIIETDYYRITMDPFWQIASIWDKEEEREVLEEGESGNVLELYEDRPDDFDNWNIDPSHLKKKYPVNDVESVQIVEKNELRTILRIVRPCLKSRICQDIIFYQNKRRIDFVTDIDWKENHVLLRAGFPVNIHAKNATFDIQYGNLERPVTDNTSWEEAQFEVCAHKWADLSEYGYGVGLLNDCKYGYRVKGNTLQLTLLKCGQYPYPEADQGHHSFTYSLLPHKGNWTEGRVEEEARCLNQPCHVYGVEKHTGNLPKDKAFFQCTAEGCILEAVKYAEDSRDIIVRVYENVNGRHKGRLILPWKIISAWKSDILERKNKEIPFMENEISIELKPYEIQTYRFYVEK